MPLTSSLAAGVTGLALPMMAWIGIDAARETGIVLVTRLGIGAALVSSVSYAAFWVETRSNTGFGDSEVPTIFLPSLTLALLGIALLIAGLSVRAANSAFIKLLSVGLIGLMSTLLLLSGNRTVILALLGVMSTMLFGVGKGRVRTARLGAFLALCLAGLAALEALPTVASAFGLETTTLTARFSTVLSILQQGLASDPSGSSRIGIYGAHIAFITDSPFFGLGPGGYSPLGIKPAVDSPLIFIVRYGLVGLLFGGYFFFKFFRAALTSGNDTPERSVWVIAVKGWLVAQLFDLPFQSHLDDKGMAIVFLLVATALSRPTSRHDEPEEISALASPSSRRAVNRASRGVKMSRVVGADEAGST